MGDPLPGPDPPVHAAKTGDVIAGKYRIEGVLGSGGMAIVLSATQLDLDRLVAIKVMRSELAETPGAVERLLLEARLTARFRNEHICKVLDVGTLADGAPYVVMEYLEGSDLHALLEKQGPFDISTAIDFILQACEGIAEAHAADIIHRDLKPENLFVTNLLDETPTVKVLDFGISKQLGARPTSRALTNPSTALGSPHYMAPEQMLSAKDVDLRADLWALGAILFELLTGRTAFEGDTLPEVCAAVISVAPKRATELRYDIPPVLADVIERCLQKAREHRFASVAELATHLVPFGSFRAASSLKRIERVLARSTPGKGLSASAPFVATTSARAATPVSHPSGRQLSLPEVMGTTDAATMVGSATPPRSSRRIVVGAAAAMVIGAIGIIGFVRGKVQPLRADQPAAAGTRFSLEEAPTQGLTAVPAPPAPPPAPSPAAAPTASSAEQPRSAPPDTHASPARTAPRAARPATAPSVAPPPTDSPKTHKATDAWDPNSFGPRR